MTLNCPHCENEIELEFWSDMQGEGCWAMHVGGVDIVEKKCDCVLSEFDYEDLTERAETYQAESAERFYMEDF